MGRLGRWGGGHSLQVRGERKQQGVIAGEGRWGGGEVDAAGDHSRRGAGAGGEGEADAAGGHSM